MPRLRKDDDWLEYRGLVMSRMHSYGLPCYLLAEKLQVSPKTMKNYIDDPGLMRMDQMRSINRILNIPAEKARAVMPMW